MVTICYLKNCLAHKARGLVRALCGGLVRGALCALCGLVRRPCAGARAHRAGPGPGPLRFGAETSKNRHPGKYDLLEYLFYVFFAVN